MNKLQLKGSIEQKIQLATKEQLAVVVPFTDLLHRLDDTYYDVVVVGEFNHGKSTFVNALLGEEVLPSGITPTTAILHELTYAETKSIKVIYDDHEEILTWSPKVLQQFIAANDLQGVQSIQLQMPCSLLEQKVRLIDTPGLNDVNTLRSEITYGLLPKADIVFFLLSVQSPLRKSEMDFLQHTILRQGIRQIVFIVNMIDQVEVDELAETLDYIKSRLEVLELDEIKVLPLSALEALDGKLEHDEELIEDSNICRIERLMHEMFMDSQREQIKLNRHLATYQLLVDELQQQLEIKQHVYQQSLQQLENELIEIDKQITQLPEVRQQLQNYLQEQQEEYNYFTQQSLQLLFVQINQVVMEQVQSLPANQLQFYVQQQLPILIRQYVRQWTEESIPAIHVLVEKTSEEISQTLTKLFQQELVLPLTHPSLQLVESTVLPRRNVLLPDSTDATLKSGIIVGGASTLLVAAGATIFMPIVAFVGLPLMKKLFSDKQDERLREEVQAGLKVQLFEAEQAYFKELESYIEKALLTLQNETMLIFEQTLQYAKQKVEQRKLALNDE